MNKKIETKQFVKKLTFLSLPLIAQEALSNSVNLLDSFMVGSLGINSINGVGFANQIYFLLVLAQFGVNSGSSIFMSQFWGKGEAHNVRKTLGVAVCINLTVALVFASLAFIIPERLIAIYASSEDAGALVIKEGVTYIRVVALTYFLCAFINPINTALKSCNQTRLPMVTTIVSMIVNAGLNYVFIFIFKWGVAGCALGTVIARAAELSVGIFLIRKYKMPVLGAFSDYIAARADFLKTFFRRVLPVMANEFIWALGTTCYTIAYKFTGNDSQGAQQIASNVQSVFMSVGFAVGAACGIMLANELGAGENERAKRDAVRSIAAGLIAATFMGVLLFAAAPFVTKIYNVDAEVKRLAVIVMYITALGYPIRVYNYTTIVGILRSGGDTKFCLFLDMASTWGAGVVGAFLGAYVLHWPIYGVVALVYAEEVVKCVASTIRVKSGVWAKTLV